jgi:hypothetical protein
MTAKSAAVGRAIAKAKRAKKAKAASPLTSHRDETPNGRNRSTVTISAGTSSVTLVCLEPRDWPVCIIGLELLRGAIAKTRKALVAIALDPNLVARREAECNTLLDRLKDGVVGLELSFNVEWIPTLKAGVSLEFDQTKKLADEQEELRLDPEETETRIKQLERLLGDLDVMAMGGPVPPSGSGDSRD